MPFDPARRDWCVDQDLWGALRDTVFPEDSFRAAPREVAAVLQLAELEGALSVLDLACGPGRHSLAFAETGHAVVAVDHTASYLEELRLRRETAEARLRRPLELEPVHSDMRRFVRPGAFDLAVSLYHSFGYFPDLEDDLQVLRNLAASVRPGGRVVVDLISREVLARIFQARDWVRLADGTVQLQERRVRDDWRWMEVTWTLIRDGAERRFDLSHRIWSGPELADACLDAGFSAARCFGGYDGRPYGPDAQRLLLIATR